MKAAIIKNDVIVNIIVVNDLSFPVDGELIEADSSMNIGYVRQEDGSFAEVVE